MPTTITSIPLGPIAASSTTASPASPASPANPTPPSASTTAQHPTIQTAPPSAQQIPGVHHHPSVPANPWQQSAALRVLRVWGIPLATAAVSAAGLVAAYIGLSISLWTSQKDFRDNCRSQNSTSGSLSHECRAALSTPLSPPPFMNVHMANSKRWLNSAAEGAANMLQTRSAAQENVNIADSASLAFRATSASTCSLLLAWLAVFHSKRKVSNMLLTRSAAKEVLEAAGFVIPAWLGTLAWLGSLAWLGGLAWLGSLACLGSLAWFGGLAQFASPADCTSLLASFAILASSASPALSTSLVLFGCSLIWWLEFQCKQVITRSRQSAASRLLKAVDALESYAVDEILRTDIPSMEVVSKGGTQDLHSLIKAKLLECPRDHPFHEELKTILAIREQLPVIRIGDTIVRRHHRVGFVTNDFQEDLANRHGRQTDALTRQGKTCLNTYKESEQDRARTPMSTASTASTETE
ncbi:hypothetical protein PV05_01449 [Exophiala xenobiotica]|uniref:Uncharacterized protein n=1 Tax=Exophiala xenobiotica TaxID=348802 RepID=A0A0D2C8M1_9EURO|nr:uncharacterized protein PV05_01449 [Exophiala xenobiotica]KIW61311.1 hypothetical protein PV05_01449 [Exophiala xenobiotica]